MLERACQAAGFEPRVAFQSDDYYAIQGFVAAGVGVCLIPDLALVAVRDDVVIRCLEGRPPVRHVLAATLAGGYLSPAAAAMLEILARGRRGVGGAAGVAGAGKLRRGFESGDPAGDVVRNCKQRTPSPLGAPHAQTARPPLLPPAGRPRVC